MNVCRRAGAVVTCSTDWWALLRQSVYSRLAGYEDTNDAERLADDPTMRVVVGDRGIDRPAASTNTMSRFETEVLTEDGNVEGLGRLNAKWVDGAMSRTPHRRVILDMDSSESPVHGEQEGASFNGHFGSTCHHPLFVFNQFGDCEGTMLRAGNVHSARRWRDVLDPILSRYGAAAKPHLKDGAIYRPRLPTMQVANRALAPNASSVVPGHSPLGVLLHRCNLGSQRHGLVLFTFGSCYWIGVTAFIVIGFKP